MSLQNLTEIDLFNLLRKNLYNDLVHVTNDEYSASDAFSIEHGIYVELKCRRAHYPDLMIEKLKYDRLKAEADKLGVTPLYICSTPKGIWEFNLDLIKIDWFNKDDLPATTEFDNKEKITKEIGLILIDKGKPILPWYPDYDSEDQFINESMTAFAEDMYVDPAEAGLFDDSLLLTDEEILAVEEEDEPLQFN